MSLKLKVSRGLRWQALSILGRQSLSMVVFATLARLLEPSSFGLVALVGIYSFFATMVADLGFGVALVQRKEVEREHLDTFFWFNLAINSTITLITQAFAGPLAGLLGEPELSPLLRWSSLGFIAGSLSAVQNNLFLREMDFRGVSIRVVAGNATGGLVGVLMAFSGYGVWSLIGQSLAGTISGSVVTWFSSSYRPRFTFSTRHLKDLTSFGLPVFLNALVWFFTSRFDQLTVGRFLGAPSLGLYVVANKVPELLRSVSQQPLVEVAVPAMSSIQTEHSRMRDMIYKGMELNAIVMFAVYGGSAMIAKDLVPLLFGPQWQEATLLCSLLCFYALANSFHLFLYPAILAAGVSGKYVILNLAHATGCLTACLVGVQFGPEYLVVGMTVASLLLFAPGVLLLKPRIGLILSRCCRCWLAPALALSAMSGSIFLLDLSLPLGISIISKLSLEITLGALIYGLFIYFLGRDAVVRLLVAVSQAVGNRKFVP